MIIARREHWVHLKLSSEKRVLVGVAQSGIKITKLGFWGMVPTRTIWQWARRDMKALDKALMHFIATGLPGPLSHTVAAVIDRDCKNIDDVRRLCARIPT